MEFLTLVIEPAPYILATAFLSVLVGALSTVLFPRMNDQVKRTPWEIVLLLSRPASHCPKCQHHLNWIDKMPVVGFLIALGKCRYCKEAIPFWHPLSELSCGILGAILAYLTINIAEPWMIALIPATLFFAMLSILGYKIPNIIVGVLWVLGYTGDISISFLPIIMIILTSFTYSRELILKPQA